VGEARTDFFHLDAELSQYRPEQQEDTELIERSIDDFSEIDEVTDKAWRLFHGKTPSDLVSPSNARGSPQTSSMKR
jgi:hypothetical protein